MLNSLTGIIDQLYDEKRAGRSLKKHLVFIVGDKIFPVVNILNDKNVDEEATRRGYVKGSREYEEFKWHLFEFARFYSANALPSYAHCFIRQLVADGLCSDVITTNYDLFFDGIWAKYPDLQVRLNPVRRSGESDWEGYYESKRKASKSPRFWKLHGSLSHVAFLTNPGMPPIQLARLPQFAIATNYPDIAKAYKIDHTVAFSQAFKAELYPKTPYPRYDQIDKMFHPFIDWTFQNDRSVFSREIEAVKDLLSPARISEIAAIIIVGFRGRFDTSDPSHRWNEEIVPPILELLKIGYDKIFMAVHEDHLKIEKGKRHLFELIRRLHAAKKCYSFQESKEFIDAVLAISGHFPLDAMLNEYRKWANYWYLPMKEVPHV